VRGNPQALFGKRPTEKDPAKGTSPAVDFTRRAGTGNGADLAKDTGVAQPAGKPAATKAPGPKSSEQPRQSPTYTILMARRPS